MFAVARAPTVARMTMTRAGLVATIAGALAACPTAASAQTFTAACPNGLGDPGSLASAIVSANAAPGPDTVELAAGCVYLVRKKDNNWYGPNALPAIASDITIEGRGAAIARDPTGPTFRLFFVGADPTAPSTVGYVSPGAGVLRLRDVTLTGGFARGGDSLFGGGGAGMGGAIFNQGTVVIDRSTLSSNTAEGGSATNASTGVGGGGMGSDSSGGDGGGFTTSSFGAGGKGGVRGVVAGGGGAGLRAGENGNGGDLAGLGAGGGPPTGSGGSGANIGTPNGGDGGGGGSRGGIGGAALGGGFGDGGGFGGGGGGVGGGGGGAGGEGGGGGFGGGGGSAGASGSGTQSGGSGGFGGGGGAGPNADGAPGFGGGTPSGGNGGGGAGMGGAIFNMQGHLTIRASTLTRNVAVGGIDDVPDHAKGIGGAVFNLSGSVTAAGSTFAANTAPYDGSSIYNLVYDASTARTAATTLRDTIVANGTAGTDLVSNKTAYIYPPNLGSADVDAGQFDLVTSMAAREQGTVTGSPLTADPLLGALRDNGGPTATMAPAPKSPALDAGSSFGLATDQRGAARPSDFGSIANAGDGSDIGAFEAQAGAGAGAGPGSGGASGGGSRRAFGARTRVTLRLGAKRIRARGRLPVIVANANRFMVTGRLAGATATRPRVALATRGIRVRAASSATFHLVLSKRLRSRFAHTGRLTLRLRAAVRDPAGHTRTVLKTVSIRLRRSRR